MDRDTTAWTRISGHLARVTSDWSRRSARLVIAVLAAGFLWVIAVAPAPVAFGLTVGLAAAWCAWLEEHPEAPLDRKRTADGEIAAEHPPGWP
jgi:hypothetical protein